MKVRTSVLRSFALLALSSLTFAACEDETTITPPDPQITVNVVPQNLELTVGQTGTLTALVQGGNSSTVRTVSYTSSNTAVATVSGAGVVTAVAPGQATITARSTADNNAAAAASVVVTAGTVTPPVTVTLTLVPTSASVQAGSTVQLVSIVNGSSNQTVNYTSSDTTVARVNATTGLVTARAVGTAVITARAAANANAVQTSVITVTAGTPPAVVTIGITPTSATVLPGGTQQFVATVAGSTNTAVRYRSSSPAVARVDSITGLATGVSTGTAVITARAMADTTKQVQATLTVSAVTPPSISIQRVAQGTGLFAVPVAVGDQVTGNIETTINVSAGTQTNIQRVEVRLNGQRCAQQTFSPPLAPTQGVATVTLVCNTAQLDTVSSSATFGQATFRNGTYTLTAVALGAVGNDTVAVATATYGAIVINNANFVSGTVTFSNGLDDADNDPDAATEVDAAGNTWFGGAATVNLTSAVFFGNAVDSISVTVDQGCDGAVTGGDVTRRLSITNGRGSVTFPEAGGTSIDNVQNTNVCFRVGGATDASGAAVNLNGNGAGNITHTGTVANAFVGPTQNRFMIDNVQPAFVGGAVTLDAADFDGLTTGAFLGINGAFNNTSTAAGGNVSATGGRNVLNASATDGGVGVESYSFIAVRTAVMTANTANQDSLAAAVGRGTRFTNVNSLPTSSTGTEYTLIVEVKDELGNVNYIAGPQFGVDLARPTIRVIEAPTFASVANNAINPAENTIRFEVTDEGSGAEGIRGTSIGYSVYEVDRQNDTDIRCYLFNGVSEYASNAANTACASTTSTAPQATQGAIEFYDVVLRGDENFYQVVVHSFDAAGNTSVDTITRSALIDVTAGPDANFALPTVEITEYTINTVANTARIQGFVRDNIEVDEYDTRFMFNGFTSGAAGEYNGNLPDEIPFMQPIDAGSYGLPLTGEVNAPAQTSINVEFIARTPADGAPFAVTQFGFGMIDLADNYAFGGVAVPNGTYDGFPGFTAFTLQDSAGAAGTSNIDRSSNTSSTLTAIAQTAINSTNPLQNVYFYYVNPGRDGAYDTADDHFTLITSVSAASAQVLTGETVREFRFRTTLAAGGLPQIGTNVGTDNFRVVAIGVAQDGDAVMTQVQLVPVQE